MLNNDQIATVKGMLARGDKQHLIAAHFGVNGGRIAEVATGRIGTAIRPAAAAALPMIDNGPRYIDPNAPLEKQVAVLDQLRKNPPENSRRVTITPHLAEHILLSLNSNNRPRRSNSVKQYADDMAGGRWRLTGDTIKFGKSGILRDGQHRLAACVRAGASFETFVLFGIDDDAFAVIDTGRKRQGDDTFSVAGIPNASNAAAAVRWVKILTSEKPDDRSVGFTNQELLTHYRKMKQPLFDDCVADAKACCRGIRVVHESALAALFYIYRAKHPKAVSAFIADIKAMKGGAKKLVNRLDAIKKQALGRMHENQRNAMLVNTLNCYVSGDSVTQNRIDWTDVKDFPVIA
jgi:hypothetical protein